MRLWTAHIDMALAFAELWFALATLPLHMAKSQQVRSRIESIGTVESAHLGGCVVIRARFG
jgi:hypothetical protein